MISAVIYNYTSCITFSGVETETLDDTFTHDSLVRPITECKQ